MKLKNTFKKVLKNKNVLFVIIVVVISIWIGLQVPKVVKKIQISTHVWIVEALKNDRVEKENKWRLAQWKIEKERREQHDLHVEADEVRNEINQTCKILCDLDAWYCEEKELCWKKEEIKIKALENEVATIRTYQNIVIHSTATDYVSIDKMKQSMLNREYKNGTGFMPCHFIIDEHGQLEKVKPLYEPAGWMSVAKNNMNSIQIEVIGRWSEASFTQDQKNTIEYLIKEIEAKFWPQNIVWHNEMPWEKTSCPWKFGMEFINELRNPVFQ